MVNRMGVALKVYMGAMDTKDQAACELNKNTLNDDKKLLTTHTNAGYSGTHL